MASENLNPPPPPPLTPKPSWALSLASDKISDAFAYAGITMGSKEGVPTVGNIVAAAVDKVDGQITRARLGRRLGGGMGWVLSCPVRLWRFG